MKVLIAAFTTLMLCGCVSSHVLIGERRPPISPDQVQVYLDPPPRFEKVAVLESNNNASFAFTQQQKTNKVMERLKEEAAALGANGILLEGVGNQYAGSVGVANAWASGGSAFGIGTSTATYTRVGSGIAIYVFPSSGDALASSALVQTPTTDEAAPQLGAPTPTTDRLGVDGATPESYERDPAKRCVACERITVPE
ncbi:hypothetical protein QFW77_18510 [Luteimonas sp. RD2P54]|uniref:Uncharacterized protein n=1 Tax=Luteimonas endophytica TaxID=3042023 RepID=A0ABT6JFK3_9GAMM|nr:hypothetical protein [Luteimonas endophytica]MDH5824963.1 hypothetical protein [Luteimonas endophytica]